MNIIFMGTPDFAVYSLEALHQSEHNILGVVTMPDKAQGRGKKVLPSPIKQAAERLGYTVLQPENLSDDTFIEHLSALEPELIVVVAFKKLPAAVFTLPVFGTVNVHSSLLPRYRGAAPINHAILNGETETGVSTFYITEEIDAGTILLQERCAIADDETFGELYDKLAIIGADLIVKTLDQLDTTGIAFKVQSPQGVTLAPKITTESCRLNFSHGAKQLYDQIRAFSPAPAAFTMINDLKFKILSARYELADVNAETANGTVDMPSKKILRIKVSNGYLYPSQVQLQGKKAMDIISFLNGSNINSGEVLGL